jgi:hypothetical protein
MWKERYYDKFQCHKLQEGYFSVQGRFCSDSNSEKSDPKLSSRRLNKAPGRSSVSNIRPDEVSIPFGLPSMSKSFKLFKVASVRTLFRVREDFSVPVNPSGRQLEVEEN